MVQKAQNVLSSRQSPEVESQAYAVLEDGFGPCLRSGGGGGGVQRIRDVSECIR